MIQTSYVSLEHPYRIVEYNGTLGLQIGTLVVTRETEGADGGYGIETHSHPVVSYVNPQVERKKKGSSVYSGYGSRQVEGVVWDKVELPDVITVGREGDKLSWDTLMSYSRSLWYSGKWDTEVLGLVTVGEFWDKIEKLGLTIDFPKSVTDDIMTLEVRLDVEDYSGTPYVLAKSALGLITPLAEEEEMLKLLLMQQDVYEKLVQIHHVAQHLLVYFTTEEPSLVMLVSKLNGSQKFVAPKPEKKFVLHIPDIHFFDVDVKKKGLVEVTVLEKEKEKK